jgi:UDP-3-O-[3-hydroxymyristoyl] glucosamine N-acyltransferase
MVSMDSVIEYMNKIRKEDNLYTINDLLLLSETNTIFDPFSILISKSVVIGNGNIIYPNVVIRNITGHIEIGNSNQLFAGLNIVCENGKIRIGNENELGENGVEIRSIDGTISITNQCRINKGAQILDECVLENGSQILGNIKVRKCRLGSGTSYKGKDPNNRGAVLKGYGYAKGLSVEVGHVIFGKGDFNQDMIELQKKYHPNWRNE